MSEFERECEEYGCPPVTKQWGNVIDMLMAQTEPKNLKKEGKMWEKKWSQICIENGWDNPDKMLVLLAPKLELWRIKFVGIFSFVCVCMRVRERKGAPLCVRKRK